MIPREETACIAGTATMKIMLLWKLLLCCQNGVPAYSSQMNMARKHAIQAVLTTMKAAVIAISLAVDAWRCDSPLMSVVAGPPSSERSRKIRQVLDAKTAL
jgi:hypothetical protein